MFGLMGAAVLGLSATQVNIVVNTIFASREVGATTWLQCAFRLMQLPLGVFGVAIATVAGAGVAQRAAAKDMQSLKETLCSALRLLAFLTVPSAVGLAVLSRPIIGLVYQHGRFAAQDTLKTADALVFYAIGLYAYSGVKVLAPAFYALGEARVAVLGSWASMACNVLANLLLFPRMGYRGVALGTSVAALVNFGFLLVAWRRAHGGLAGRGLFGQLWRVLLASACLAAAANSTHRWLGALDPVAFLRLPPILVVFASILAGGLAYLVAARALAIGELSELWASLGRRRG
jgi:putative peptidoglycan lipid II flippase